MFGGEGVSIGIVCWCVGQQPSGHRWTSGESFPTSAKTAGAFWAGGGIDYVVAEFGMGIIDSAIEVAVENDTAANSSADRDVDETGFVFASAPSCFSEGGSVTVVFQGYLHLKELLQIRNNVFVLPAGEEIHISECSGEGVDGAGAADADTGDFRVGLLRYLAEEVSDAFEGVGIAACCVGGSGLLGEDTALVVDHADGDFGASDIDGCDQCYVPSR